MAGVQGYIPASIDSAPAHKHASNGIELAFPGLILNDFASKKYVTFENKLM